MVGGKEERKTSTEGLISRQKNEQLVASVWKFPGEAVQNTISLPKDVSVLTDK